jgi:hypothetical protein
MKEGGRRWAGAWCLWRHRWWLDPEAEEWPGVGVGWWPDAEAAVRPRTGAGWCPDAEAEQSGTVEHSRRTEWHAARHIGSAVY